MDLQKSFKNLQKNFCLNKVCTSCWKFSIWWLWLPTLVEIFIDFVYFSAKLFVFCYAEHNDTGSKGQHQFLADRQVDLVVAKCQRILWFQALFKLFQNPFQSIKIIEMNKTIGKGHYYSLTVHNYAPTIDFSWKWRHLLWIRKTVSRNLKF